VSPEEMKEVQRLMYSPEEKQQMREIFNESPFMQEWLQEWSEQAKKQARIDGWVKGRAKGRAEGTREGKIEKAQDDICTYLKIKYATIAPIWLGRIKEVNDLKLLNTILVQLFQAANKKDAQVIIQQALKKR